jgi:transglycosylase-like protein
VEHLTAEAAAKLAAERAAKPYVGKHRAPAPVPASPVSTVSVTAPPGSFQSCVISRESGGNPNVMNSSGHYGLYQFDYGTWVSGGGNPADFGHASVAEQNRVFQVVYAARGAEPWAPSDGC